jgi:ubiquinone/menaquinone biosynthesis C-methylase UbiE
MDFELLRHTWNRLGATDPLWSVLTHPGRKHNRWQIDDLFHTGEKWVDNLMRELSGLGVKPQGRCLDFGCGVGRLTQALCHYFDRCDGVDIAASMITLAQRYNRHGDRCRYHVNDAPDLRLFPDGSFDFICSLIVLQHIEPTYTKAYINEFVRLLRPGGVAVFQLPSAPAGAKRQPSLPMHEYKARITPCRNRLTTHPKECLWLDVTVRNDSSVTLASNR